MKEIKTSDFDTISQSNKISETFNPDKRIEVKERPVNGNFTESDKVAIEKGINLLGNDDFKDSCIGQQRDDSEKGYLRPNYEYTAGENNYSYQTDAQGRIIHAEAHPLKEKPWEECFRCRTKNVNSFN